MTEKVIHEVRFIETDEGFRIEVNGDKERLRGMGFGPGMMGFGLGKMGFGPWMHKKHRRRHGRYKHHKHHFGHGCGPWSHGDDEAESENVAEKSPKAD